GFFDIAITIGCAGGKHVDDPGFGSKALAAPSTLGDLRPLILSNHPLKLQQQSLLWRIRRRCFQKSYRSAMPRELLQQEHLVSVIAAQTVRPIDQHCFDSSFSNQITQPLQTRPHQRAATIALVLESPLRRNRILVGLRMFQQGCCLAGDGLLILLSIRGDSRINGCRLVHKHYSSVLRCVAPPLSPATGKFEPTWPSRNGPNGIERSIAQI